MKGNKTRLYLAYGSNLNLGQMAARCPGARVAGSTVLRNHRLLFAGRDGGAVATVVREKGCSVPVGLWEITPEDERALDTYEGYPRLYRKEYRVVCLGGRRRRAMAYVMDIRGRHFGRPSRPYLDTIREGYASFGFEDSILFEAVWQSTLKGEAQWT